MDVKRNIYREDHEMFRTTVRRFVEREYLAHQTPSQPDTDIERQLWLKAGREGLLCVMLPAQFGGGGDFGHAAVMCEEFARVGISDKALSIHSDIIAPCIALLGNDEQKHRWLPGVCKGEAILALAVAEPGGKAKTMHTRAVRYGDHYLINGNKVAVSNGMTGDLFLLACRTGLDDTESGVSLIMVEAHHTGLTRTPGAQRGEQPGCAHLSLVNVRVPVGNLLGETGRGMQYLGQAWTRERLLLATFAASRLEYLLNLTLDHVQQPDSRGVSQWDLAHTRFKLADIKSRAVALRVLVDYYLDLHMRDSLSDEHAALANLYASEALRKCTHELARLRGGYGPLRTHSVAHSFVDDSGSGAGVHEIIALGL